MIPGQPLVIRKGGKSRKTTEEEMKQGFVTVYRGLSDCMILGFKGFLSLFGEAEASGLLIMKRKSKSYV